MTDMKNDSTTKDTSSAAEVDHPMALEGSHLLASRRQLLLRGILKGSAIAATAVPIKSMATAPLITNENPAHICSISGQQSLAHSRMTSPQTCGGYSCVHYQNVSNWPNYNSTTRVATNYCDGIQFTQNDRFDKIFPGGSSSSMISILTSNPTSESAHWITALLNSIKPQGAYIFTHTRSEVRALYRSTDRANAYSFFKNKVSWRS
jgi:hypothetical protein